MGSADGRWLPRASRLTFPTQGTGGDGKCHSAAKPAQTVLLQGLAEMIPPPTVFSIFPEIFLNKCSSSCCKPFVQF